MVVCAAARGAKQSGHTGASPATAAEAALQVEHRLKLARLSPRLIGKMAMRIDRRFLATSDALWCAQDKNDMLTTMCVIRYSVSNS